MYTCMSLSLTKLINPPLDQVAGAGGEDVAPRRNHALSHPSGRARAPNRFRLERRNVICQVMPQVHAENRIFMPKIAYSHRK